MRPVQRRSRSAQVVAAVGVWLALMSLPASMIGVPDRVGLAMLAVGAAMAMTGTMLIVVNRILKS